MDIIHALILAVIEGITEFLPVSSTGHLMIAVEFLGVPADAFTKTFEIAIQSGAILAVIVLYPRRLFLERAVQLRVAAGFMPTALIGFVSYKFFKAHLSDNIPLVLASLFFGGILIIMFERLVTPALGKGGALAELPLSRAAWIGVIQSFAIIPGISRSGATVFGAMFLGLSRDAAVEYSFLLAVPTMAAATGYDLLKNYALFTSADFVTLMVGFVGSFAVALFAIKFLIHFIRTHNFEPFGWYRIVIALFFFFILL